VPAYIVIDRLTVTDSAGFAAYQDLASAAVQIHGGRYLLPDTRRIEALEGNWRPNRIVLIEFEDTECALQWWSSLEYAPARALHRDSTIANVILMEGISCSSGDQPEGVPAT
jgi:uncharacterized protein (DUF1330 family)